MIRRPLATPLLAGLLLALALGACATRWTGSDYYVEQAPAVEPDHQLSGEALVQRKQTLRRLHRDLKSFHSATQGMRRHRNLAGISSFEAFLHPFLERQVEPLVAGPGASWHPELELLQANLLFAEAALLIELRDRRRLSRVAFKIGRRFAGRGHMLVEYPLGEESTLQAALRVLARDGGLL